MADCQNCDGTEWVCENHPNKPWDGESSRGDACGCGAGMPCNCIQPDVRKDFGSFVRQGYRFYRPQVKNMWDFDTRGREVVYSKKSGEETYAHYVNLYTQQTEKNSTCEFVLKGTLPRHVAFVLDAWGYTDGKGNRLWESA
jgi:hypothetical protein